MKATFMTPVVQAEDSNATGLRVPAEAVAELGAGKRPKDQDASKPRRPPQARR